MAYSDALVASLNEDKKMNAYAMQDAMEQRAWDAHQAEIDRDAWIADEANRLLESLPSNPFTLFAPGAIPASISINLCNAEMMEKLNDYLFELCNMRAIQLYELRAAYKSLGMDYEEAY